MLTKHIPFSSLCHSWQTLITAQNTILFCGETFIKCMFYDRDIQY